MKRTVSILWVVALVAVAAVGAAVTFSPETAPHQMFANDNSKK